MLQHFHLITSVSKQEQNHVKNGKLREKIVKVGDGKGW